MHQAGSESAESTLNQKYAHRGVVHHVSVGYQRWRINQLVTFFSDPILDDRMLVGGIP